MSIEKAYNLWAKQYDSNANKTRDLDAQATIQTLHSIDFSTVVELGCGSGKNTAYLLQRADKVTGLDFSEEMLNLARHKIQDSKVEFRKTDLTQDWNIASNYADLITCSLVLEHIKDLNNIFLQAHNTLKNKGFFFISELHPYKQYSGSKARFETKNGTYELETYVHHISEYYSAGLNNGFELVELKEWFDNPAGNEPPRLIGMLWRKTTS